MKTKEVYGVKLTSLQEMFFDKYMVLNNNRLPSPNTISKEERRQLVLDWLNDEGEQEKLKQYEDN